MLTPFPLLKRVLSGAEGDGVLFWVLIPSALVMGGIDHEWSSRGLDIFYVHIT